MTDTPASLSKSTPAPPAPDLVTVAGLQKSFGANHVLRGIDFTVPSGSVTTIIGPSGSGKTTILRSLNALDVPDGGEITIGNVSVDFSQRPIPRALLKRYQAQSGMVFQGHNLFPHKTVIENVLEGPLVVQKRDRDELVAEAEVLLRQVGLEEKRDQYPHQLSGGQQQRVGIARALALKPLLMLFDEPTSALDPELVGEVLEVMKDLATQGWTMVVVTHEIRFAQKVANQVLFADGGTVLEKGTPAEVIANPRHARTKQFLRRLLDPV
ncbi:glutamine ABC transporter ATP-binding protein [Williamsia sp. 1138]|uniref:amino acid ABC transporter ATP-binding protein n=1 Tax=Williamsia sp. 1138 TaxID=1903117 RepID=UPI000A0F8997|nr:amino acid ABC transporter ATP-binding protein [Williamsia sp. 1138]OZG30186.1 glutamine ABC transporter ATP-binding protein [Williamsia sp. 1138]